MSSQTRTNTATSRPRRRLDGGRIAVVLSLFRLLTVVSVVQLSGVAHIAGDLFELVTLGTHTVDDVEHENDPSHECPPGCPTCHHVHFSGASLPPTVALAMTWVPTTEGHVVEWLPAEDAPLVPPLSSVYRPPRT